MRYLNGCTFGYMSPRGFTRNEEWKRSLRLMAEETGCDTVIVPVAALQDHAYSTHIDFSTPDVMSREDVLAVCAEARRLGLRTVVKAMVNCRDGYWRAYIRFFDNYVPTEPTWEQWFTSYDAFVLDLADTAQAAGAEMFCVGCEMVGADHRARDWRSLIAQVRERYAGLITYNCDKYQEDHITWWDAVDVMSGSGYYPMDQLEENFRRIEGVVRREGKDFLFMESGCPSRQGSEYVPNDWRYSARQSLDSQAQWYRAFTDALLLHSWVRGAVWWDWGAKLYPDEAAAADSGYGLHGKPAARVLEKYSRAIRQREESRAEPDHQLPLAEELRAHLTVKILPFWEKLRDDVNGGFYGYVDKDLVVSLHAHKGCILNSRILWTFSTAYRVLGDDRYLPYARHAYAFMDRFADTERGGVYWSVTSDGQPLDKTKHTYCQAFAIYGLAAYARATGDQAALRRAMELFRLIETRCSDAGGYGEAYRPDFSPESNEKLSENGVMASRTMNTLLHVLEAYAELYRAGGDEDVRLAGVRCLERFLHVMYSPDKHRLEVFFDADYRPLLDMQSYGHDIEGSWLIWDAAEAMLPAEELAPYRAMCADLARSVFDRAMTDHGLRNEAVDNDVNETRVWWVQAEALLGMANAYTLTGDDTFLRAQRMQWQSILRMAVDPRPSGEWYWATDEGGVPTGQPIVEEWKCPYHNSRMCLRLIDQAKG